MFSSSNLGKSLTKLIENKSLDSHTNKPHFFRLIDPADAVALEKLIEENPSVQVTDAIEAEIEELLKCMNPLLGMMGPEAMHAAKMQKIGDSDLMQYGVWVYYPWSNKLVHLLDEVEFAIVRTNRNKHKITVAEQELLSKKKIGVMGLSVGQSVSLTLAMERGFGELRIADFDSLDLSNLNRIRTGVHNLGVAKTTLVAREIAEIDPFLKVVCYPKGITAENINDFLTEGGHLDLLIDECDSFDIKINARKIAKSLGIPVLMEGSDRGTIDIERFDLEPERPVLHGMIDHLDMEKISTLKTLDEKIPYITAVTGAETLSPRMKGSAMEIMATISTWPQLASAVTFGGGVTADLSRKILLNLLKVSGRFFIDLDELIKDTDNTPPHMEDVNSTFESLNLKDITQAIQLAKLPSHSENIGLSEAQLNQIIEAGSKAPSGGNNQPWHFHYENNGLYVFLNKSVAGAFLDPDYQSSYLSIGAAIENIKQKAYELGFLTDVQYALNNQSNLLALLQFEEKATSISTTTSSWDLNLAQFIDQRHTNRKIAPRKEISLDTLTALSDAYPNLNLKWVQDPEQIKILSGISGQADLFRLYIPEAYKDFIHKEMRWTPEEVLETEDGIGVHTLDLSNNDLIGMRLMKDRRAIDFLRQIKGGNGLKRLAFQQFMSASAIGLITVNNIQDIPTLLDTGQGIENLWLKLTSMNYQFHPLNVPLLFFYKHNVEKKLVLPEENKAILNHLENTFNSIFKLENGEKALFMFRIFEASPSPERTIRKQQTKIHSRGRA
ncbi:MAG: Rv1355c family protein [Pedobacter sp.]|nr:MAG: Rv1355c family protein [Pedobacter sp.]